MKPDLSPVTDADRATERMLRERIARDRPGEGVLGEEEGDDAPSPGGVRARARAPVVGGTRRGSVRRR
jgi:histidinol-phosphatase